MVEQPTRRIEPLARGWRQATFSEGTFDTGHRPYTEAVEGTIRIPDHLLLVTLHGGAQAIEIGTSCGHRYAGPDRAGAVSFVPAGRERWLKMRGVRAGWASLAFRPGLIEDPRELRPFTNVEDPFLFGLIAEFERLYASDGALDPLYCEAMTRALACYLARRSGQQRRLGHDAKLPAWRVRRIADYVEAHLGETIRIDDLASLVGLSAGHLHRAFRASLGVTPLAYVNERRVARAMAILSREPAGVAELALRVGFVSPSHFARTFRRVAGVNPARFRAEIET